jgi:predicted transcriptional regulator
MEQKIPRDDFGTFLLSVQQGMAEQKTSGAAMQILQMLSQIKEVRVEQLISDVKAPWSQISEGLKSLQGAGLIEMDDDEDSGTVCLTDEGERWANTIVHVDDENDH